MWDLIGNPNFGVSHMKTQIIIIVLHSGFVG